MHALNRDVNGLLIYTKTKLDSTDSIEVNDGQGFGYNGFEGLALGKASDGTTVQNTLQSDFDENTDEHYQTNAKFRKYQQVRFDSLKLLYFINDDGMLVARYMHDYEYAASERAYWYNWYELYSIWRKLLYTIKCRKIFVELNKRENKNGRFYFRKT